MGKLKVSFTTALFVFSFLICVIVAVVFVDRTPKDEYNSFYEKEAAGDKGEAAAQPANPGWDPSAPATAAAASPTAPPAAVPPLTDLPIDPHLVNMAQTIPATATPAATVNPMVGRSPEEIARALMGQAGVNAKLQASEAPGIAVPQGIATPAAAAQSANATPAPNRTPQTYFPMQSNVQGGAGKPGIAPGSGGPQLYQMPSLTDNNAPVNGGITNSSEWSPVASPSSQSNLIGVHKAAGGNSQGMMIGDGHIETGAQAPPGVSNTPTNDGTMAVPSLQQGNPASALPGSNDKPLLFPPGSSGDSKWELPPAPTLRPPPIQDPDKRRSDAEQTPDSLNPEGASDQALAISGAPDADENTADKPKAAPEPAPNVAAQVNDQVLTKDAALRMARATASLNDKIIVKDEEQNAAKESAESWKKITAAAEQAEADGLEVGAPEVEHYAAMRPDFDPAAWQLAMEDEGFSQEEIRRNLKNIALSEKLIEVAFEKDTKDDDLREAYEESPSKYKKPRTIHLQEIYKAKPKDKDRAEKVEREMKRLQRQAASGTDFGLLARQASEAPTAKRGGNLGWINPAKNEDSDRDKALKDLKDGEVTEVIEEEDGYRIYRLVEEKEAAKDFDSAKDVVVAELKKPVRKDCFEDALKKLEAGELAPPNADSTQAIAAAPQPTGAVVPTRVGSSLVAQDAASATNQNPQKVASAKAAQELKDALEASKKQNDSSESSAKNETADAADGASDGSNLDEDTQRKFRAQQLLGEANAARNAGERQQTVANNQTMNMAPSTSMMRSSGQPTQLLYAPGTQPQQMAGGQPRPPYQAGGQFAAPVQASMQTPTQASFNHMGATSMEPDAATIQAAQIARIRQEAQSRNDYRSQQQDQNPNQTRRQSNGWDVVKNIEDSNSPPPQPQQREQPRQQAQQQPQQQHIQAPPGFETGEKKERRGIVGSVKSFFGSL